MGRGRFKESRSQFPVAPEEGARLAEACLAAARTGDPGSLKRLLAEDAVLRTDGGGKRRAALRPIFGWEKITRFFVGISRKVPREGFISTPARINVAPGFVITESDGSVQTMALEIQDGLIAAVSIVCNPEKLRHLVPQG